MSLYSNFSHPQQYQHGQQILSPSNHSVDGKNLTTGLDGEPTQVSVVPQSQGMVWNGSQWVTAVSQQSKAEIYTAYYHQWIDSYNSFLAQSKEPLPPHKRSDLENQIQWTKYYADLSSQAAHYFYNNPDAVTAPFQLPPAPVKTDSCITPGTTALATVSSDKDAKSEGLTKRPANDVATNTESRSSSATGTGEGALKRYVDRCLVKCKTPEEKARMVRLIEQMIQEHLQNNTYQVTMWDNKELLTLHNRSGDIGKVNTSYSNAALNKDNESLTANRNNGDYYGPQLNSFGRHDSSQRTSHTSSPSDNGKYGYYGPSVATSESSKTSSSPPELEDGPPSHHKFARKSKKHKENHSQSVTNKTKKKNNSDNYYGPSSSEIPFSHSNPSFQKQEQKNTSRIHSNISQVKNDDFIPLLDGSFSGVGSSSISYPGMSATGSSHTGFNNAEIAINDRKRRFNSAGIVKVDKKKKGESNSGFEFDRLMGKATIGGSGKGFVILDESDYEKMTIKGTCQILEKDYLRLTAPPKAELVRPQPILEQHLLNLKALRLSSQGNFDDTSNNKVSSDTPMQASSRDYLWFCSQLKAIRQDCTVQRIQNAFTIDVYETHAHIALEEDDLNEYNQCQTQLKELYKLAASETRSNSGTEVNAALSNRNEFLAYRIIYHVLLTGNKKYKGGSSELWFLLLELTAEQKQDHAIQHALKVREACCNIDLFDYHLFFMLYRTCPNSGKFLMKHMIPTVRYNALQRICKGYRPSTLETDFVLTELGFVDYKPNGSKEPFEVGYEWLISCGCVLSGDRTLLITKDSIDIHESTLEEKKSLI